MVFDFKIKCLIQWLSRVGMVGILLHKFFKKHDYCYKRINFQIIEHTF